MKISFISCRQIHTPPLSKENVFSKRNAPPHGYNETSMPLINSDNTFTPDMSQMLMVPWVILLYTNQQ